LINLNKSCDFESLSLDVVSDCVIIHLSQLTARNRKPMDTKMNATQIASKIEKLEQAMSTVAGFEIELTIRGERAFTVSAEGEVNFDKLIKWLNQYNKPISIRSEYAEDCDFSCLYFTV
jgi:hypothetical protein